MTHPGGRPGYGMITAERQWVSPLAPAEPTFDLGMTLLHRPLPSVQAWLSLLSSQIACSAPGLQAGGEGSRTCAGQAGRFCCSMYWLRTEVGAPPTDPAK
jgi:hypothetical protein